MINIIIADDHAIVRQGLSRVICLAGDIHIVDEAKHANELFEKLPLHTVDLVLTDMSMPGLSGVELITQLKERYSKLPVLVMSMHSEVQLALRAIKAGACGYLTKDSEPQELITAIRRCVQGGNYISSELASVMLFSEQEKVQLQQHELLSERERQIFYMLVQGVSVTEIAEKLFISSKTVSTHKHRLMQKMSVSSLSELIRYAIKQGILA